MHANLPSDLAGFRDFHRGETIVVCGCGASLSELREPWRFITIGVNDVGRLFDPTYLVVLNPRSQFKDGRFRYVEESRARALFTQLDLRLKHPHVVRFRLGRRGGGEASPAPDTLDYSCNSPYVALMLALRMGAARIALIGVDFTDHHFFAPTGRHPLLGRLAEIDAEYAKVARTARARGVEIVNLSAISRLAAFPKNPIDGIAVVRPPAPPQSHSETRLPMRIAVEKHTPGIVGDFLDNLAHTAAQLGHQVSRVLPRSRSATMALSIVWNGRDHRSAGPSLYCEHAWLPRWEYQLSPGGINADSHLAPFQWDGRPLSSECLAALNRHLDDIRAGGPTQFSYMQTAAPPMDIAADFLLVPLQMEWDTNIIRHVPARFRQMQVLVDYVTAADPPLPVIYKQHPADVRRGSQQLRLRLRRRQDKVLPHNTGNIHQLLKSGKCRGIISLNSNVVHDGLLWDVPSIVLGNNIWPREGRTPFLTELPREWSELQRQLSDPEGAACRQAYAHYLMVNQWKLSDTCDAGRVRQLLEFAVASRSRPLARGSTSAAPRDAPRAVSRPALRRAKPRVNVAAINRGWLFEDLKRHFAARARLKGFAVVASDRPVRNADAWIFIRTKEAVNSPNPGRTLVQIHDMADNGLYRPGGERACVERCAAVALTHPSQKMLLEDSGVGLDGKAVLCRPIGALKAFGLRQQMPKKFTVGWVGRPTPRPHADPKRIDWFLEAVRMLGGGVRVVLLGERLEAASAALSRERIDCVYCAKRITPIEAYPRHYASFDALVVSSATEAGPMSLFEALATGVPVVSTRVGWASILIQDGVNGRLVDSPEEIAAALEEIRRDREQWFERRQTIRESLGGYTLEGWVDECLQAASGLA